MNDNFICIKVDREERPDIDYVFQSSYQLFNQSGGGWPLTIFLDENAIPFMAGTYFPKIEEVLIGIIMIWDIKELAQ